MQLFERGSRPLKDHGSRAILSINMLLNFCLMPEEVKAMTQRVGLVEKTVTMGFVGSLLYGLLPKIVYLFRQATATFKNRID